jgi:flagellar motor protein MotB
VAEDEKSAAGKAEEGGEAEKAKPPESPWTALLKSLGEKALTALLTVGGLAAFAAFAGSLVLWTRFNALQLPQDQIVDLIPREEAITTGTTILLLFGFCGAIGALVVYLIDRGGRATPGMSRGVLAIVTAEAVAAIWLTLGTGSLDRVIATEVVLLAFGAILWITQVGGLVELEEGAIPDLVENEPDQEVKPDAFRKIDKAEDGDHRVQKSRVSRIVVGAVLVGALVAGGAAWAIARLAADSVPAGWAAGLAAVGLTLFGAVVAQWLVFEHGQKEARENALKQASEKRKEDERKHVAEREKRKRAARKAHRLSWAAWFVSWLKADARTGREKGSDFRLSLGAPGSTPSPVPREEAEDAAEDPPKGKPPLLKLTPNGKILVLPFVVVVVIAPALILGERWLATTLAATIVIGIGLWRIAELSSARFALFGLAIFLSAPLFGTIALTTRNIDDPQAQPVAIIRGGDGPAEALQGLYVTETDKRVYFANVATQDCGKKIVQDSGRLFWIPEKEVVAMSIGPSQDIDKAARASLEMSYALTPDIETAEGGHVSLLTEEQAAMPAATEGKGGEPGESAEPGPTETAGKRLQSAGPAVRPKFGIGLRLEPAVVPPDRRIKLVVASPEFKGLGGLLDGSTLRLNGVKLPIRDRHVGPDEDGKTLPREWIEFEVPKHASSGVVTVECSRLAGQPFLRIPTPTARVTVRMLTGSERITFDSARSTAADGGKLVRRWTVAGLRRGRDVEMSASLPPRLAPYPVTLTVTDRHGQADEVDLRVLRLPDSRFPLGADRPKDEKAVGKVRRALRIAVKTSRPAKIELDGHADAVDTEAFNMSLSLRRARWMRRHLFALHGQPPEFSGAIVNGEDPVPMTIQAFGETCPIIPSPGPQEINRRVEVFLLDPGATVATGTSCHSAPALHASW